MDAVYVPDRLIVAALQRIEPKLSVSWVPAVERWAVYHDVPPLYEGRIDEYVDHLAGELQRAYSAKGYAVHRDECERQAYEKAQAGQLVCYVAEDDGSYRPLDQRIVKKLERMDYLRRNLGLQDWKTMLDVKADAARKAREREAEDFWTHVRRDKTFTYGAHDMLWGLRPVRSVTVPDTVVSS